MTLYVRNIFSFEIDTTYSLRLAMSLDYRACNNIARLQAHSNSRWKLYLAVGVTGLAAAMLGYVFVTIVLETHHRMRYLENEMQSIGIEVMRHDQMLFNAPKGYQPSAEDIERSNRRTKEVITKAVHTKMTDLELEITNSKNDILQLRQTIVSFQIGLKKTEHTKNDCTNVNLINYALESMGATIDSIGHTQLASVKNPPRMLMHASRSAGECFGFLGQKGEVVIRLQRPVRVDAVSIDHISSSMSPNGTLETAPKEFSVYGMFRKQNIPSHFFGTFRYDKQQQRLQLFPFAKERQTNRSFQLVQFKFLSNHGHAELTCVYQTGVHGQVN